MFQRPQSPDGRCDLSAEDKMDDSSVIALNIKIEKDVSVEITPVPGI